MKCSRSKEFIYAIYAQPDCSFIETVAAVLFALVNELREIILLILATVLSYLDHSRKSPVPIQTACSIGFAQVGFCRCARTEVDKIV